jgi:hypothetical protein
MAFVVTFASGWGLSKAHAENQGVEIFTGIDEVFNDFIGFHVAI